MTNMTAVEWLVETLNNKIDYIPIKHWDSLREIIQQALEMEKQERQKVNKLLDTLLENNMCSHAGDKLIEQFKKDNQ